MEDIKKNLRLVFGLFVVLFAGLILYLLNFEFFVSSDIVNTTLNPRVTRGHPDIVRGNILDAHGVVLATSLDGYRNYPFGRAFSHVVGHTGSGHAGVEERYNFSMVNISGEFMQRVHNIANDSLVVGDSVVLTIDAGLQQFAHNALGNNRGSIVVLDPFTGAVLAMVSSPSYDPNTTNWHELITNHEESPLLNRSTQGLYPPGSTFKIVTAAAALPYHEGFVHYCTGYITLNGTTIRCFNSVSHGQVDMTRAFALSCNTYFVALADEVGEEALTLQSEDLHFNKPLNFPLRYSESQFTVSNLAQTAIGQGQTLATPLHMTMIAGTIANGGTLMEPFILDHRLTTTGFVRDRASPTSLNRVFTDEIYLLQEMMVQVVQNGTGRNAAVSGIQIAGKTGTAETGSGESHGWFVGYAPAGNPQIAFGIMLENSGGTARVLPIARDIVSHYLY